MQTVCGPRSSRGTRKCCLVDVLGCCCCRDALLQQLRFALNRTVDAFSVLRRLDYMRMADCVLFKELRQERRSVEAIGGVTYRVKQASDRQPLTWASFESAAPKDGGRQIAGRSHADMLLSASVKRSSRRRMAP